MKSQISLCRQWEHAFFFRIKAGNLSVFLVKLSSLQVPHHTIQSALWKQTMLSLGTHKYLELQVNGDYTHFVGLTTVNDSGLFSDLIFADRISLSFCHISRFTYLGSDFFLCWVDKKCDVLYDSFYCHWCVFFHVFKYSLCLKLAGLRYQVKVLKCLLFCELSFCFELVTHGNSDMALWICYSVPEYYDYGHGTSEEAYDSYGKVSFVFCKCVKSRENICRWQFRNYFHKLFFISLILQRPNKIDLCNFKVSFDIGPENWTDEFK